MNQETKQPETTDWFTAIGRLDNETAWFAVDSEQVITWWSPGAERLLGFPASEVVGEHCSKAIFCVRCGQGCGLKRYGQIHDKKISHYTQEGREIPTLKRAVAIHDENGAFMGGVEMLRPGKTASFPRAGSETIDFHGILTRDPGFIALLSSMRAVAYADVNVLIRGETGSGKEMVARALHAMSRRAGKPFVAVNCGTLSKEFLASEIFGHKRGAFTGAVNDKQGLLSQAEGGTLFLDEVAEMPLAVQAGLLRVIQERRYRPLGGMRDHTADVRLISATHASLREAADKGNFREDLMYRLRVVPFFLPPLRDRPNDIELLWEHMLARSAKQHGLEPARCTPELLVRLKRHPWPGNVRELINLAEYVTVTRAGMEVMPEHLLPEFHEVAPLPEDVFQEAQNMAGKPQRGKRLTRAQIENALEQAAGSMEEAAQSLGVSRITLWRRRKKLGMV